MTISAIPKLPIGVASGAQTTYTFDNIVTPSESGRKARKALRMDVIRNYVLSIGPEDAQDFQHILISNIGNLRAMSMRDWSAYSVTDEELEHDGTTAPVIRTWAPLTGTYEAQERILIIDQSEVAFTLEVDGVAPTSGSWSWSTTDLATVIFSPPISPSSIVTWSGEYLMAVALLDDPTSTTILGKQGNTTTPMLTFADVRLEQLLEEDLLEMIA